MEIENSKTQNTTPSGGVPNINKKAGNGRISCAPTNLSYHRCLCLVNIFSHSANIFSLLHHFAGYIL